MSIKPFPHPDLSLWQSAVDQVVARHASGAQTQDVDAGPVAIQRPDTSDGMVQATVTMGQYLDHGVSLADQAASAGGPKATEGVGDWAKYCSSIWWQIAKAKATGNAQAEQNWRAQLGPFSTCDPRYAEAAEQYVAYFKLKCGTVPYKVWSNLDDFVIDGVLPAKARVAIVGDWGTGQQDAKALLAAIARKNPDVVIHLGDIYYSGTQFEMDNYFMNIWKSDVESDEDADVLAVGQPRHVLRRPGVLRHDSGARPAGELLLPAERRLAIRGAGHGLAR